jgi:uncharacterized protein (DUF1330 family)
MSAYLVAEVEVLDRERFETYRKMVPASLEPYGGKFLVRGGNVENLEGEWLPKRLVILEFPSAAKAKAWWESDEYAAAKALRHATARTRLILAEGIG